MHAWLKIAGLLLLVWAVAAGVVLFARSSKPDPEKLAQFVKQSTVAELSPSERENVLNRVILDLNRMDFEQRRTLQRDPALRDFFDTLSAEEKSSFLERTLPEGFRQMMIAFNQMEPERRKRLVERALADIEQAEASGRTAERSSQLDEEMTRKIVDQGLQAFYSEASADVKLDLAPVIERIQESLQSRR